MMKLAMVLGILLLVLLIIDTLLDLWEKFAPVEEADDVEQEEVYAYEKSDRIAKSKSAYD